MIRIAAYSILSVMQILSLFIYVSLTPSCFAFEEISGIDEDLQKGTWIIDVNNGLNYTGTFDQDTFTIFDSSGTVIWKEDWYISDYIPFERCNPHLFDENTTELSYEKQNNPFHPLHDHSGTFIFSSVKKGCYFFVNNDGTWNMKLIRK